MVNKVGSTLAAFELAGTANLHPHRGSRPCVAVDDMPPSAAWRKVASLPSDPLRNSGSKLGTARPQSWLLPCGLAAPGFLWGVDTAEAMSGMCVYHQQRFIGRSDTRNLIGQRLFWLHCLRRRSQRHRLTCQTYHAPRAALGPAQPETPLPLSRPSVLCLTRGSGPVRWASSARRGSVRGASIVSLAPRRRDFNDLRTTRNGWVLPGELLRL